MIWTKTLHTTRLFLRRLLAEIMPAVRKLQGLARQLVVRPGLAPVRPITARRWLLLSAIPLLPVLVLAGILWQQAVSGANAPEDLEPWSPQQQMDSLLAPHSVLQQGEMPVYGWQVCADMGIGPVPGIADDRQRFRLCHNDGWRVRTYCVQPNWPPPVLGAACVRFNDTDFYCGQGLQNLRIYEVLDTPTPSPTPLPTATQQPTSTPAPTFTNTPVIPSPLPTRFSRPQAGGMGFRDLLGLSKLGRRQEPTPSWPATPTPFQPEQPAPTPAPPQPYLAPPPFVFVGADLAPGSGRVRLLLQPDNRRVNSGETISLSFVPAERCPFGDKRACTAAYYQNENTPVTFVSVHSGVGGEAQALRHALEGTGFDAAAYSLPEVRERMKALRGSAVELSQGGVGVEGYQVAAVVRIPASRLKAYLELPLDQALALAAELEPTLAAALQEGGPLLVLETCGWRMRGEPWPGGLSNTSASIYLVVVR